MSIDPQLPQRLASPGETFEYADGGGTLHEFSAGDDGHIQPANATEDEILAQRGFPRIEADPQGPTRSQLQARAKELGLSAGGNKAELTAAVAAEEARLEAEANRPPEGGTNDNEPAPAGDNSGGPDA